MEINGKLPVRTLEAETSASRDPDEDYSVNTLYLLMLCFTPAIHSCIPHLATPILYI